MSVLTEDTIQVPIDLVGALYTLSDPMNNPPGASPNVQDAQFLPGVPGTVGTRPGLSSQHVFPGNPTINYTRTFRDLQQNFRNLYFDSLENLWEEFPENSFHIRGTVYQSKYVKSDTAFGREWLAFSDGKFGTDAPRQWDGANLDRVSQDGSGVSPTATPIAGASSTITAGPNGLIDFVAGHSGYTTSAITTVGQPAGYAKVTITAPLSSGVLLGDYFFLANGIFNGRFNVAQIINSTNFLFATSITGTDLAGRSVTFDLTEVVPTSGMPGLTIGAFATITGATDTFYNGSWPVREQIDGTHFFVLIPNQSQEASSGGGTVTVGGNIAAGVHQMTVLYVTRNGYLTRPAPPISFQAVAGQQITVSNIPVGPANVIARILAFTAAGGANFYYIPTNFVASPGLVPPTPTTINDNVTTSATFDFTDTALLSSISTNVDDLFDNLTLGEVAGFMQYANRIFAWGERNKLNNLLNLGFDGGAVVSLPTGWKIPALGGTGGSIDTANTTVTGLAAWRITGDGATAKVGALQQGAAQDYLGVPIILPNTPYSVRLRLHKNGTLAAGTFHVNLSSVSGGGIQGTDAAVAWNDANLPTAGFFEYILPLTVAGTFPTTVPSDLLLNVYVDGTPTLNGYFTVDDIQIFPTLQPYNLGLVRASDAADPETFKGTTGFLNIAANDDQRVSCLYPLRDTLRIAKEHGLFSTSADPASEPDGWNVVLVSSVAGSVTLNSAGPKYGEMGKEWAALLCREGIFLDYGNTNPEKLNQEVQRSNKVSSFSFDGVNWAQAHTAWITVDLQRRRMLVGLPMGAAVAPSVVAAMDFRAPKLGDPAILAQMPLVAMSTFTNKQVALSGGRKWCPWTITANCGGMIERSDGTAHLFLGNGAGNGKLYDLLETQTTDDGATIPFFFQASYLPDDDRKNIAYKFQGGLVLCKYLRAFVQGSGNLSITLIGTGGVKQLSIPLATAPAIVLANPAGQDIETMCDFRSERISVLVSATGAGSWMSMQKLEIFLEQNPVDALRGSN